MRRARVFARHDSFDRFTPDLVEFAHQHAAALVRIGAFAVLAQLLIERIWYCQSHAFFLALLVLIPEVLAQIFVPRIRKDRNYNRSRLLCACDLHGADQRRAP